MSTLYIQQVTHIWMAHRTQKILPLQRANTFTANSGWSYTLQSCDVRKRSWENSSKTSFYLADSAATYRTVPLNVLIMKVKVNRVWRRTNLTDICVVQEVKPFLWFIFSLANMAVTPDCWTACQFLPSEAHLMWKISFSPANRRAFRLPFIPPHRWTCRQAAWGRCPVIAATLKSLSGSQNNH